MKTQAPEKKSVKTLKGQLFGAISMMLVAAIALGTSTYAWFIGNQTVEVQNMQLTVSTSTALLAAVGKPGSIIAGNENKYAEADYTTFKTVIVNNDIIGTGADQAGWAEFLKTPLKPASVCDTELLKNTAYPQFFQSQDKLTQGMVSHFTPLTLDTAAANVDGLGQGPVKHVRFAFQASEDLNVYFGRAADADVTPNIAALTAIDQLITPAITDAMVGQPKPGEDPTTGQKYIQAEADASKAEAEAIKAALRIAIVPERSQDANGSYNTEALVPVVLQFNDEAAVTEFKGTDGFNTYYKNGVTDVSNLLNAEASGAGYQLPNTTVVGSNLGKYPAVKTVSTASDDTAGLITETAVLTATTAAAADKYIASVTVADGTTTVTADGKTPLFALTANTPRVVDVYFWLEGTDEQCVNFLSDYSFNVALPFVAGKTVTPAP